MKTDWSHLEPYRVQVGKPWPDTKAGDKEGGFEIPVPDFRERTAKLARLFVLASDGAEFEWEHVSVHVTYRDGLDKKKRVPTWSEMCYVKDLFWEKGECVVQFHPAEEEYVNRHPYTLHLWKERGKEFPTPPRICV